MKPSKFDGKRVIYIDQAHLQHSGVVVGASVDGKWLLVRADGYSDGWQFRVAVDIAAGVIVS